MSGLVIEENVSLKPFSTFRVGGSARYFARVETIEQLKEALDRAKKENWPIFILAGGSNLIICDQGFPGLVLKIQINSWQVDGDRLTSGPASSMAELVDASIAADLQGLEWAGGLPGSFGGAIRGNAGAFAGEIKDSIESVTSLEIASGREIKRSRAECEFGYRESIFKHRPEIIVSATLKLASGDKNELRASADEHIQYRKDRHPLEYPNAGSIFKNTPVDQVPQEYLPLFADAIKVDPFPVVPTALIIAKADLKGLKVGQAQVSQKHTNYIVNLGEASSVDIIELINQVKKTVAEKYQINLEVEPELVGF